VSFTINFVLQILLLSSTRNSVSITPAPESSQIVNKPFLTESIATQEEMEIETPSSASGVRELIEAYYEADLLVELVTKRQ